MTWSKRKTERVIFTKGYDVKMVGIDGTWQRPCQLIDISATGAKLNVEVSISGLQLKEFFLLLSATGLAFRRCQLVRINGTEIGVQFVKDQKKSSLSTKTKRLVRV
ncbi:MAG: PilZ domain-containing protein [Xanthobacteraceae bacterium]|nr:PilZ domain-containing protein [Xanthobacteraceae bacterium]